MIFIRMALIRMKLNKNFYQVSEWVCVNNLIGVEADFNVIQSDDECNECGNMSSLHFGQNYIFRIYLLVLLLIL